MSTTSQTAMPTSAARGYSAIFIRIRGGVPSEHRIAAMADMQKRYDHLAGVPTTAVVL